MSVTTLGHGLAALAFAAGFLLLLRWRAPATSRLALPLAFAAMVAWSGLLALDGQWVQLSDWSLLGAEALRYLAWYVALTSFASSPVAGTLRKWSVGVCVALCAIAVAMPVLDKVAALHLDSGRWLRWGVLLLCCTGLVLVEQLLRSSHLGARALKLCAIGIGGQFAYDLFLYSRAELMAGMDAESWAARGFVQMLLIPVLLIGHRQRAGDQHPVFVSRHVVFYTTSVLTVGTYLLLMSIGGYYVRQHGGSWGELLRLLFFVGAVLVLLVLVLSESIWRRLRIFISKHFYRYKFDYRVEWLRFINTLSYPAERDARFTAIRAIAQIFGSSGGALYLKPENGADFESAAVWREGGAFDGVLPQAVPRDSGLVRLLEDREWVIDLVEYRKSPALYRHVDLPEWLQNPGGRWRIVTPLLEVDSLMGFMVLQAPPEPFEITFEDRDLLKTVGRHVATLLAQQAADRKLAEGRQFDAFNRFAAFVMHDLKNSVAQLQLLVTNAAKHRYNPAFMDDAIDTIANSVDRMTHLIDQLESRETLALPKQVSLAELLGVSVRRSAVRSPKPTLVLPECDAQVMADPERLGSVLDHLIRNAQEATGPSGTVSTKLEIDGAHALLKICDNGPGMSRVFIRDRLFRPFDGTKGSKGMGIGAYQAKEYVRQLNGIIEVQSTSGAGTTFTIRLPLCQSLSVEY